MYAYGDKDLLAVVLDNLIGNAWKYAGGSTNAVIEFGIKEYQNEQVYFVKDNGVEFEMKYRDKPFLPFQRLHGKAFEGTGIGLTSVNKFI